MYTGLDWCTLGRFPGTESPPMKRVGHTVSKIQAADSHGALRPPSALHPPSTHTRGPTVRPHTCTPTARPCTCTPLTQRWYNLYLCGERSQCICGTRVTTNNPLHTYILHPADCITIVLTVDVVASVCLWRLVECVEKDEHLAPQPLSSVARLEVGPLVVVDPQP